MKLISNFLLVLYTGFLLCRPVLFANEKFENSNPEVSFNFDYKIAKVYTAPIFQNTGSIEVKNNLPFSIASVFSTFNFQKEVLNNETPKDTYSNTIRHNYIEWPKISINAP